MTKFQCNLFHLAASKPASFSTQSELIGLSPKALTRYCLGLSEPSMVSLMQLATYYIVSIDYLVGHNVRA